MNGVDKNTYTNLLIVLNVITISLSNRRYMTKKHHPHNRAERLALKELDETKQKHANVRRKLIKEALKQKDTEDELREAYRSLSQ